MSSKSLATWNINSVRLRLPLVERFLAEFRPDVLCLQEIKCQNEQFPKKELTAAGYPYQAVHGQKGYHGVAIISKFPLTDISTRVFCEIEESRHVSATLDFGKGPVTVHNFYIPAGGDEPDPEINPKFKHKLGFLAELQEWFGADHFRERQLICGDFNIAPLEHDVWSHKQLLDVVSHTPVETNLFGEVQAAFEWTDVTRRFVPPEQKIYSWWSYRAADWEASDRGRRLDHVWASPGLKDALTSQAIFKKMRGWQKASDHVPIMIELDM